MTWNRFKIFMLGCVALSWLTLTASAQQLRTDTLFLQSRESVKWRLRLEQERALRKQTPNPDRVAAFLEEQSIKADRLEFDAAQDAFKSQEAFNKNRQNWQTYLTEKSQEQSRLREIQEKQKLNEKKEGFDQLQREFLAKERRKQAVLRKRFLASQFKSGSDLQKEQKRYEDFVALKAQQAKKLIKGDPDAARRKRLSEKANDFIEFAEVRQRLRNKLTAGTGEVYKHPNQKEEDYRNFVQGRQESREKANLVEGDPNAFLKQKYSEKAKEFQEFITKYNRANAEQKQLNAAGSSESAVSRKQSEKAKEFQAFVQKYNQDNAEQRLVNASGTAKTALSRQESEKTKEFQEFVQKYNQDNAEQRLVNASGSSKTALSRQESEKAKEFQAFVQKYNQDNAEQRLVNASGSSKTALSRQESEKAKEFQAFVQKYNQDNAEQRLVNASGTAKTALSRQESEKAKEFQAFVQKYNQDNAEQRLVNASGTSEGVLSKKIRENRAKYNNFVDTKRKEKVAVLGYSGVSEEEAYRQVAQSKAKEFEEFVQEKKAQSAFKEGDSQTGNAIRLGEFRKKAFREFIAQQQARHAQAPLESGFQRPSAQANPNAPENNPTPVQPIEQTVPVVPLTPKHAQIRSSDFDDFLTRAQRNQDRSTRN